MAVRVLGLLALAVGSASGIELLVSSGHARCLTEQMNLQGLAVINWDADAGAKVGVKVFSPTGALLHDVAPSSQDHVGFQAKEAGDYQACFEAAPPAAEGATAVAPPQDGGAGGGAEGEGGNGTAQGDTPAEAQASEPSPPSGAPAGPARVRVEWLTGVGARDWADVAKKSHVAEVTAALSELEAELSAVYTEMLAMRTREESLRDTSERVNSKISWMSVMSLTVSCCLATWQITAMKKFLTKKKIV